MMSSSFDPLPLVIYHHPCPDGATAAWVANKAFAGHCVLMPLNYGQDYNPHNLKDRPVYMIDFSFKREELIRICKDSQYVVILDHHESAERELEGIEDYLPDGSFVKFDMSKCGAVLTHNYFYPSNPLPKIIEYIQDRDLWNWELPNSQEVSAAIKLYDMNIESWDKLMQTDIEDLVKIGQTSLKTQNVIIGEIINRCCRTRPFLDWVVPVVNCPAKSLQSDLLHVCAKGQGFAVAWGVVSDGSYELSFRSDADGLNVSKIAESLGGGGHKHAAGAKITKEKFEEITHE